MAFLLSPRCMGFGSDGANKVGSIPMGPDLPPGGRLAILRRPGLPSGYGQLFRGCQSVFYAYDRTQGRAFVGKSITLALPIAERCRGWGRFVDNGLGLGRLYESKCGFQRLGQLQEETHIVRVAHFLMRTKMLGYLLGAAARFFLAGEVEALWSRLRALSSFCQKSEVGTIPAVVGRALVVAEDHRFFCHCGADLIAVVRASSKAKLLKRT